MELEEIDLNSSEQQNVDHSSKPPESFPIVTGTMHYNDFYRHYLETNTPCLIRADAAMKSWSSCTDWVDSDNQVPCLEYFTKILNEDEYKVPVSNCGKKFFNCQEKCDMPFGAFLKYWNDIKQCQKSNIYYLKDWHFVKEFPQYKAYRTPSFFSSDWLNEYLDYVEDNILSQAFNNSDYRFVYAGPKDSWTPLHADVFGSYSWSANVIGEKEWIFFPPGYEKYLINPDTKEMMYDINEALPFDENYSFQCKSISYDGHEILYYKVRQKTNEIIFVPSGWYHQVKNIVNTISINHNWFNASNIQKIWNILKDELKKVEAEIKDCKNTCEHKKEWNDMCQNLLRANHGMNMEEFLDLCIYIARKRISSIDNAAAFVSYDGYKHGQTHLVYDIKVLKDILSRINRENTISRDVTKLINEIDVVLSTRLNSNSKINSVSFG